MHKFAKHIVAAVGSECNFIIGRNNPSVNSFVCHTSLSSSLNRLLRQPQRNFTSTTTTTTMPSEYVEKVVCNDEDIKNNEMKQYALDDDSNILLIRQHGELSAIGSKCSHYGAPLSTGALGDGRVRCPWHGACFNIKTGDIEDFPGQDSIPCYKVTVTDDGKVSVRAKRSDLAASKRLKDMVRRDKTNDQCFVVVGGGPSGGICVETLRQQGFTGRLVLVCKENQLPYDRIKVSKAMDLDVHKAEYRTQQFYDDYDIETMLGVEATKLDAVAKTLSLSNGYVIKYDKLYLATGSKAEKVKIEGAELKNVKTIRTFEDSAYVADQLGPDKHVVCLGLSFISLESAAYCVGKAGKVTVIGRDSVLLRHSFGPEIGQRIQRLFEENHVDFRLSSGIKRCISENGVLTAVELNDGSELKCDVCIMGTGSSLYTKFMEGSGVAVNTDGSIDVNELLQSNHPDVYAGGDIANAPVFPIENRKASIGHYGLAQYHGRMAAKNMVGAGEAIRAVPFFWTMLFGKSFRYSGYGKPHETQIVGSLDELKYVAIYYDAEGKVIGMSSCQRDPVVSQFGELQTQGRTLLKRELQDDPMAWTKSS